MTTITKLEPLLGVLETVSIEQMREAAKAWRAAESRTTAAESTHDRIDDLIDEVERLRRAYDDLLNSPDFGD